MSDRVFSSENKETDTEVTGTTGASRNQVPGTTLPGRADTDGNNTVVWKTPHEPSKKPFVNNGNPIIDADGQQAEDNEILQNTVPPITIAEEIISNGNILDERPPKQGQSASDATVYDATVSTTAPSPKEERVFTVEPPLVNTNGQRPSTTPNSGVNQRIATATKDDLNAWIASIEQNTGATTGKNPFASVIAEYRFGRGPK